MVGRGIWVELNWAGDEDATFLGLGDSQEIGEGAQRNDRVIPERGLVLKLCESLGRIFQVLRL